MSVSLLNSKGSTTFPASEERGDARSTEVAQGQTGVSFGLSVGSRQDSGVSPRAGPSEQGTGHRGTQPRRSSQATATTEEQLCKS